jgi:hypothetical protein
MPASGSPSHPQARKLGLAPGTRLRLDGAPSGWELSDAPPGLIAVQRDEEADIIIGFFATADDLARRVPARERRIPPSGMLWVAWPRRAGGHTSDITDNVVRGIVLPLGLVDTKVAALDHDWSALRVVWRRERRSAAP